MKEIYRFIRYICDDLNIKNPNKVEFKKMPTDTMIAYYDYKKDKLAIKKDYKDIRDVFFAIAHELRHKYQVDNDVFDFKQYKTRDKIEIKDYNLQKEEIDANAYAAYVMMSTFGVKPLFNGLDEDVKKEINKRIEEVIKEK